MTAATGGKTNQGPLTTSDVPDEIADHVVDGSLADVTPSILASFGIAAAGLNASLELPAVRRVCLLLIDGLGWENLRSAAQEAQFLSTLVPTGRVLAAGFPATTATSLATIGTGRASGRHGMLGYQVAVPGSGQLLNCLRWQDSSGSTASIDPLAWQPEQTVFERAAAAGVAVTKVAPGAFEASGLTQAALRGGAYSAAETLGERIAAAHAAIRHGDRSFVYVYFGDLDATGHRQGWNSPAWREQLVLLDRFVERLAWGLLPDSLLWITADHGMIDVPLESRFDYDESSDLQNGVALLGGEARARHVYTRPGAAADVLSAWQETLEPRMHVSSRDEAVNAGWFGQIVTDRMLPRIGDVVAVARGQHAVVATRRERLESSLIGMHGALTQWEQLVPLLGVQGHP